ncbi:MAG TPA: HEAT repeat domain-containing protein [Thermoanaerobaculia bacterium]|nr:HEAT repeat domain-containing protein [Thermoanaerobaculia bacterium]
MHALLLALLLLTEQQVRTAITPLGSVDAAGIARLKTMGPEILPHLAHIYSKSNEDERATIAWIFYALGLKSPEARKVLLKDIHTQNEKLRLQVQWALGRVSDDTQVVDILAGIMRDDPNALFRDKAACALAYDQIHLTEKQKVQLYAKLIDALGDPKLQVRQIAITALNIHTGQTKGFNPNGAQAERDRTVAVWKKWLAEYEKNL